MSRQLHARDYRAESLPVTRFDRGAQWALGLACVAVGALLIVGTLSGVSHDRATRAAKIGPEANAFADGVLLGMRVCTGSPVVPFAVPKVPR